MEIETPLAEPIQLTHPPTSHEVIYPEAPVFSPDSRYFVYMSRESRNYWVHDTKTSEIRQVNADGEEPSSPVVTRDGKWIVYLSRVGPRDWEVKRMSLESFRTDSLFKIEGHEHIHRLGSITPCSRYLVTATTLGECEVGILVVDLKDGSCDIVLRRDDISNPHMQVDPKGGQWILVQQARGQLTSNCHDIGLLAVHRETKELRQLNIGLPHTFAIQGHQCWAGVSGKVLVTTHLESMAEIRFNPWPQKENVLHESNLFSITIEENKATPLTKGHYLQHIGCSLNGRYWTADAYGETAVYVGSVNTGRYTKVAYSGASDGCHEHPSICPSGEHVFFNCDKDGANQLFTVHVAPAVLKMLESP